MTLAQYHNYLYQIAPIQKMFWGGDKKGDAAVTASHAKELRRRHIGKGLKVYGKR